MIKPGVRVRPPRQNWELHGPCVTDRQTIVGPMTIRGQEVMYVDYDSDDQFREKTFICEYCAFVEQRTHKDLEDNRQFMCPRSLRSSGLFLTTTDYAVWRMTGEVSGASDG